MLGASLRAPLMKIGRGTVDGEVTADQGLEGVERVFEGKGVDDMDGKAGEGCVYKSREGESEVVGAVFPSNSAPVLE